MAYERTLIRQQIKPRIPLEDLDVPGKLYSLTYGEHDQGKEYYGADFPMIVINGYRFEQVEIFFCEIESKEFLPTIDIQVKLMTNLFMAGRLPMDGDVVSVYIRSFDDAYKPIRNDYLITEVYVDEGVGDDSSKLFIKGVLNIKDIWIKRNKAFRGTSVSVIQQIADELQLGYASNFTETPVDEMVWLCDWSSYKDFLQHISKHAWLNEQSFFRVFIDVYYNINFIEVNRQLDNTKEFDEAVSIVNNYLLREHNVESFGTKLPRIKGDLILTNHVSLAGLNIFVEDMEMHNRSSTVSYTSGYTRKVYYYDHTLRTIEDVNVIDANPLATPGTEDTKIRLRGKLDENYHETHIERSWSGVQYSNPLGNVHQKFNLSVHQNDVNNLELEKLKMESRLPWWNPAILRGARVPMVVFLFGEIGNVAPFMSKDEFNAVVDGNVSEPVSASTFTIDRFKSGFYYVDGFKITYEPKKQRIDQTILLTRREWGVPQDPEIF